MEFSYLERDCVTYDIYIFQESAELVELCAEKFLPLLKNLGELDENIQEVVAKIKQSLQKTTSFYEEEGIFEENYARKEHYDIVPIQPFFKQIPIPFSPEEYKTSKETAEFFDLAFEMMGRSFEKIYDIQHPVLKPEKEYQAERTLKLIKEFL